MNNSKLLHDIRDIISEQTFPGIKVCSVEAEIVRYDMGKLNTECDNIKRHSKI